MSKSTKVCEKIFYHSSAYQMCDPNKYSLNSVLRFRSEKHNHQIYASKLKHGERHATVLLERIVENRSRISDILVSQDLIQVTKMFFWRETYFSFVIFDLISVKLFAISGCQTASFVGQRYVLLLHADQFGNAILLGYTLGSWFEV